MQEIMLPGAFVLKLKTPRWRLCVVKQVPEQPSSCWMLFGQNRNNPKTGTGTKATFQMEFQSHQDLTLINHLTDLADHDETELRLILVSEPPAVSCIASLWQLQGQEMYRKQLRMASSLHSSLHQDLNMLRISPQMQPQPQQQQPQGNRNQNQQQPKAKQSMHSMQTRSKTRTN
uniref:Uncharacterized protein n=1 Tax=viral metagenome TaxID=1070528 RepID=A0A6C0M335_9ZZZZ